MLGGIIMISEKAREEAMQKAREHAVEHVWDEYAITKQWAHSWETIEDDFDVDLSVELDNIRVDRENISYRVCVDLDNYEPEDVAECRECEDDIIEDMKNEFVEAWAEEHWEEFVEDVRTPDEQAKEFILGDLTSWRDQLEIFKNHIESFKDYIQPLPMVEGVSSEFKFQLEDAETRHFVLSSRFDTLKMFLDAFIEDYNNQIQLISALEVKDGEQAEQTENRLMEGENVQSL